MEIIQSKINQFPNYFLLCPSRNGKLSNKFNTYNYNKFHNSCSLLKSNNNNNNGNNFPVKFKNIETQTSLENYIINNNINKIRNKNNNNNIKSFITFENKALNNYISSYSNKPKLKNIKLNLDKLFISYYPKILNPSKNKKININNNNIKCIQNINKYNNKFNSETNIIIKNIKNKKQQNKSFKTYKSFPQKYYKNKYFDDYKEYNNNEYKDEEINNKFNNPILIKDIEISKLLDRIKNKKNIMKRNFLSPNQTIKKLNRTQLNKIFINPDIINHKKTIKDLFYSKLMNTKIILNKKFKINYMINNNNKK